MHVKFRERWYDGTRIRGLKSLAYIELGYIFDNREMAEEKKRDIRKVSKYQCIQVSRKLDARQKFQPIFPKKQKWRPHRFDNSILITESILVFLFSTYHSFLLASQKFHFISRQDREEENGKITRKYTSFSFLQNFLRYCIFSTFGH